jgi:hypothetical protein
MNLASVHLMGAERFSRRVGEIERQHQGQPFGDFWEEILHNATACVFAAVASLEAYVNETYVDREHLLKDDARALLESFAKKFEGDFDKTTLLAKFHLIIFAQGGAHMDKGAKPYQDVNALIQLRNALVHYRPEWDTGAGKHQGISFTLSGRFAPSPFVSGPDGLFPRKWATHGCEL